VLFRNLLAIDIVVALVVVYFFLVGLNDGSVSSFNIELWLYLLSGVAAIIGGGTALHGNGYRKAGIAVLMVMAVPGVLFGLFALGMIVFQPRWN